MDTDKPISVLESCEKGLRQAAGEALADGQYGRARQIMAWAENVAAMLMVARSQSAAEKGALAPQKSEARGAGMAGGKGTQMAGALEAGSVAPASAVATGGEARILSDEYPRFLRRGDELVKVAWSKSDGTEYMHRAPRAAVDAVVAKLNELGAHGKSFASEAISPLKDMRTGGIIPTYQIFAALAWLRKLGVVRQEGRKSGYTVRRDVSLDEVVNAAWGELGAPAE